MNPVLQGIVISVGVQIVAFLLIWAFKKRLEKPDDIEKKLTDLLERLQARTEKSMEDFDEELKKQQREYWVMISDVKESVMGIRVDLKGIQSKINGNAWKH